MLVILQPFGRGLGLGVWVGSEPRQNAGIVFDDAETREDIRSSLRTLFVIAEEGLFALRTQAAFVLEFHYRRADDWQEFLARPKAGDLEADLDLLAAGLADPAGRIVATELTRCLIYDRVD